MIQEGGNQVVQVKDNGHGVPAAELPRAFKRYSTSKIVNIDDLFNIQTLGFRGEALASIASVAEVEFESSTDKQEGSSLRVSQGVSSEVIPAPGGPGTTVTVRNLFYIRTKNENNVETLSYSPTFV